MDKWSTSRYCTFTGSNLVTWHSKKQAMVAKSSAKAEFRAIAHRVCETLLLKIILKELGFESNDYIQLYCDNKVTISIARNPIQYNRTKHIEIDRYFIK